MCSYRAGTCKTHLKLTTSSMCCWLVVRGGRIGGERTSLAVNAVAVVAGAVVADAVADGGGDSKVGGCLGDGRRVVMHECACVPTYVRSSMWRWVFPICSCVLMDKVPPS